MRSDCCTSRCHIQCCNVHLCLLDVFCKCAALLGSLGATEEWSVSFSRYRTPNLSNKIKKFIFRESKCTQNQEIFIFVKPSTSNMDIFTVWSMFLFQVYLNCKKFQKFQNFDFTSHTETHTHFYY